jgi:hypothetical protein
LPTAPILDEAEGAPAPSSLAPAELLMLWALRAWANMRLSGGRPQTVVGPALALKTSARTSALFLAWMQAVEAASRRRLEIHRVACAGISADEWTLITACGLAVRAPDLGVATLQPVLHDADEVILLSRTLHESLAADGRRLPARLAGLAPEPVAHNRTLH